MSSHQGYYGALTQQQYESAEARDHAERNEALKRKGLRDAEHDELVRQIGAENYRRLMETENARAQSLAENAEDIARFLASHPDYIDNPHNGAVMAVALIAKGYQKGARVPYEVLEETAAEQADAGNIQINQKVRQQLEEAERERERQAELAEQTAEAIRAAMEPQKPYDPLSPPERMIR
jgi:hypothetical protein